MIVLVTLSIREDKEKKPFRFCGATGNIQGDKFEKSVSYESIAQLFSYIGDDIRDVVLKEQIDRQENE